MQEATRYVAEAWNYISVGMDAKAAQGFHHLRDTKPSLAFSRAANQFWCALSCVLCTDKLELGNRVAAPLFLFCPFRAVKRGPGRESRGG